MKFSLFFDLAMVVSGNGIPDRKATEAMMESVKTNPISIKLLRIP